VDEIKLLDHGYIKVIKFWGDESEIIESARMSTGGDFNGWDKDFRLLKYLYENRHDTPFEFVGATFEIKAPIFVFREWHRHRTQSYNEMSGRYIPIPNENYMPDIERIKEGVANAGSNKQAGSLTDVELTDQQLNHWLSLLADSYDTAQAVYDYGLDVGIPKELARLSVPVSRYSVMRANTSLRNWISFLRLRQAPNAQKEIRVYADTICELLNKQYSKTIELYRSEK
jgi:thymidylate synthase (FAD)